ncbi:uncharacterized protein LOC131152049 isoform X2 [Malania oleifera]|uniref:uncharacterized protein LOC131152049 isoform X2 n=1 Tax=Malania oleifera TaxID=397392 RepID=UPI0025ADC3A3|nr:uncharacterized protein LOC131152049 isoform X2 [Malania oleifera]
MEERADAEGTAGNSQQLHSSLFPLPPPLGASIDCAPGVPQWLCNTSFTTDLTVINDAVSSHRPQDSSGQQVEEEDGGDDDEDRDEGEPNERPKSKASISYELLESSPSDAGRDSDAFERSKRVRKKKKRKRKKSGDDLMADDYDFASRKPAVRSWASSDSKPAKDYHFDSHGDKDNLAFGSLYRMDVARYKLYSSNKLSGPNCRELYWRSKRGSILDREGDVDTLDGKLKSDGRYWSAKYAALERHKNLKRVRIVVPKRSAIITLPGDFIPLLDLGTSLESGGGSLGRSSVVEESWEDEVLRKTREFNKMSRERPHDEKVWLSFAEFQDRVASMQPQKGARLQTLEKKISILEKATELNPENEELLLGLLKAYQNRDTGDVLIGRWEKILVQHSRSYKLWKEFLRAFQGEFSRFKVSDTRKMYAHAIQALSAACSKQCRQVHQTDELQPLDSEIVQLELGLVDIFLSLCRFEWQAGYQELATSLFQAEIEYSLFCPLFLTEQSKQRLFEYFWNGNGARIGEEGAVGWSTWLEKEEENRQRLIREEYSHENDKGGWTGWSEPLSRSEETSVNAVNIANNDVPVEGSEEEYETHDLKQENDTETLLKMLGIDVDSEAVGDVKDAATWTRWSEEESSRDCEQWMPLHAKSVGGSCGDGTPDREADEQLMRVILFEDVTEYLFSLSSREARFSLVSQFIDFYGGKISQWFCTNSFSWMEKTLSSEAIPDSILEDLRRVHDVLTRKDSDSSSFALEFLLGNLDDTSSRTDMMKFLRDAVLLLLTAFPHNYMLEEAALLAEEMYNTRMNSSNCSVTPCRALAKCLLKNDRQDVLLCGVYARREAAFGNIVHARKIFDMALSSVEGLPLDLRSKAPLLYFWYAEMELASSSDCGPESFLRPIHILCCLGSGSTYSPYKCQPSNLQLLRAHQGFKEQIRVQQSAWRHGVIEDYSIALICSAALFEELTSGLAAGIDALTQAFSMVLPEKRSQSYQLEILFNYYMRMFYRHHKLSKLSDIWGPISQGLQIYPYSPKLFSTLVEISHLYAVPNKLRWMFDDYCQKSKKLWLDGFLKLNSILTAKELSDLQEVMRDKELNLRTDVFEILLQDEIK